MLLRFWDAARTRLLRLLSEDKVTRWRRMGAAIGNGVFIGSDVVIDEGFAPLLTIEDGAVISARTVIMLHDSALNNVCGLPIKVGRVTIGKESYIGANSTVLCGVTVGRRTVVGAASLVTSDIPDESVAFGCPAAVQGTLDEFRQRFEEAMMQPGRYEYWRIMPWRDRQRMMSTREYAAAHQAFLQRVSASTVSG